MTHFLFFNIAFLRSLARSLSLHPSRSAPFARLFFFLRGLVQQGRVTFLACLLHMVHIPAGLLGGPAARLRRPLQAPAPLLGAIHEYLAVNNNRNRTPKNLKILHRRAGSVPRRAAMFWVRASPSAFHLLQTCTPANKMDPAAHVLDALRGPLTHQNNTVLRLQSHSRPHCLVPSLDSGRSSRINPSMMGYMACLGPNTACHNAL